MTELGKGLSEWCTGVDQVMNLAPCAALCELEHSFQGGSATRDVLP